MEHQATEVSYDGEKVVARCACGYEVKAEGAQADADARAALEEHVEVSD